MLTPKHPRNPVTAFFRGLYAELAFSGESLHQRCGACSSAW
ncbi:MAG: hypothetical protein ACLUNZ_00730 [Evtepia sp.]